MVVLVGTSARRHAFGHEPLGGRVDHAVFFRDEKPARQIFPSGSRHRLLDARSGDRSLDRGEQGLFFGSGVLCECGSKSVLGQPNQPVAVGFEFWRLRVRGIPVEDVGDGFAFVGRQATT